jgi:isochorismate hydrolase
LHKNRYLKNIPEKSDLLLKKVFSLSPKRNYKYNFKSSALILVDMQNYFFSEKSHAFIPSSEYIIEPVKNLISAYEKNKGLIVFTRHINNSKNAGMMNKWWGDIIVNNQFSEIFDAFNTKGKKVIIKSQYDAFQKSGLGVFLQKKKIKQLVICGVMTNLCCETTARSAFVKGFEVFFPVDSNATYNEMLHLSSLYNLSYGFAHIVKSDELIKIIKRNGRK